LIEVRDLTKLYGDRRALGPISFGVAAGDVVGFLGLNGAGKSTALRILACDLLPSGGEVRIDGMDVVDRARTVRTLVGFLPDRPPLYPEMTVAEYLRFVARLRGVPAAQATGRVDEVVRRTHTDDVADAMIGSLSQGYAQRVGIAQAIVHQPRLLILDEPFTGLDPVQIVEMRALVRGFARDHTVLVSSHNLGEIHEICDRILVIREGQVAASGTEGEVLARMRGGVHIEVTVRGAGEAACARARGVAGVAAARVRAEHDGLCDVEIDAESDVREAICAVLVAAGLGVVRLDRGRRELEQAFMELSRGDGA
jgi:gliding motility-associated transport system ATP-binding protein